LNSLDVLQTVAIISSILLSGWQVRAHTAQIRWEFKTEAGILGKDNRKELARLGWELFHASQVGYHFRREPEIGKVLDERERAIEEIAKEMKARNEDSSSRLEWARRLLFAVENGEEDRARAAEEMVIRLREDDRT